MNTKNTLNILCFLTKIKEDKRFYTKHKTEIDRYIKLTKAEIEAQDKPSESKSKLKSFWAYFPQILHLFSEYFNST